MIEKDIYDMAVLPEYRTDKNASSNKLMAEMMNVINQRGGEWHAEMRDRTTFKYLQLMEKRGKVKLNLEGIDHTMSDGSKVFKVTFHPIRPELQKLRERLHKNEETIETTKENVMALLKPSKNRE